MKELLAVDVALLLPEETNELCKQINTALVQDGPTGFAFDSTHFPHVTLVQQFVLKSNLAALCSEVGKVLKGRSPLRLQALETAFAGTTTYLRIAKTKALRQIHDDLVNALAGLSKSRGDGSAFFSQGQSVQGWEIEYVSEYREAASFDRYDPHVTLGVGRNEIPVQPFSFTADLVGLYHLGKHCTCRRRLQEWRLNSEALNTESSKSGLKS